MALKETKSPRQILQDMKTAERARIAEIERRGAAVKAAVPLAQEQRTARYGATDLRRNDGSGDVFLETFMAGDEEVVLVRSSDLRKLSGVPGVKGFTTYAEGALNSDLVGGPGDGTGYTEVREKDFVTEAYAKKRKRALPPAPPKFINPQAFGRKLNNPRYEAIKPRLDEQGISEREYKNWLNSVNEINPEWEAWYDKNVKNNPAHRSTQGSDGLATVYTPHVNVGGGFHFIPGVQLDGKPVYVFDNAGALQNKVSPGNRVRRLTTPTGSSYANQMGEYDASEIRVDLRPQLSGKDIADAYKKASRSSSRTPPKPKSEPIEPATATQPRPSTPTPFESFELPVVDTPKGRRRAPERRFSERQALTDKPPNESK